MRLPNVLKTTRRFGLLLIVAAGASVAGATDDPQNPSAERILSGIRARPELLGGVSLKMRGKTVFVSSLDESQFPLNEVPLIDQDYALDYQRGKIRFERTSFEPAKRVAYNVDRSAWNGEIAAGYGEQTGQTHLTGSIKSRQGGSFTAGYFLTAVEQRVFDLEAPLAKLIDTGKWTLSGPEKIGPYTAWKLASVDVVRNLAHVTAWIDPAHGFAPVQLELEIPIAGAETIRERMSDVELKEVDGVWVVSAASLMIYNPNVNKQPALHRYTVSEIAVHREFPDDHFVLKFPTGAEVWDSTIGAGFVVGPKGERTKMLFLNRDKSGTFDDGVDAAVRGLPDTPFDANPVTAAAPPVAAASPTEAAAPLVPPASNGRPARAGVAAACVAALVTFAALIRRSWKAGRAIRLRSS